MIQNTKFSLIKTYLVQLAIIKVIDRHNHLTLDKLDWWDGSSENSPVWQGQRSNTGADPEVLLQDPHHWLQAWGGGQSATHPVSMLSRAGDGGAKKRSMCWMLLGIYTVQVSEVLWPPRKCSKQKMRPSTPSTWGGNKGLIYMELAHGLNNSVLPSKREGVITAIGSLETRSAGHRSHEIGFPWKSLLRLGKEMEGGERSRPPGPEQAGSAHAG